MKLHAISGLTWGCPYCAVGIQRALELAIGLPRRSTSAWWMLAFLIPAEVRRSFIVPPEVITAGGNVLGAYGSLRARDWQTTKNSSAPTRFRKAQVNESRFRDAALNDEDRSPVATTKRDEDEEFRRTSLRRWVQKEVENRARRAYPANKRPRLAGPL